MAILLRKVCPLSAAAAIALTVGCGGGGDSKLPSSPSNPNTPPVASSYQYAGAVAMANGTSGIVTVLTFTRLAAVSSPTDLYAVFEWFAPRLLAQGTATGALSLNDGTTVALSGTTSGSSVQMTGAGGYTASLSASGGSLSGTVTAPQGPGTVAPIPPVGVPPSVPSNPAAVYTGSVNLNVTDGYFFNRIISQNRIERSCLYQAAITGTIRFTVFGADANAPGRWTAEYNENLQYRLRIVPPCPDVTEFESIVSTDSTRVPGRVSVDLSNIQVAFASQWSANNGSGTENTTFVGAMTGTTINARFGKSRRFGGSPVPNNEHFEGWNMTETSVALQKQ